MSCLAWHLMRVDVQTMSFDTFFLTFSGCHPFFFHWLFIKVIYVFIHIHVCVPMCQYVHHVLAVSLEARRGHRIPRN